MVGLQIRALRAPGEVIHIRHPNNWEIASTICQDFVQMDVPETSELQAFAHVAEAGSVSRAAQELGVPRATVGHRLTRLEERLGVRLMHRTTRRIQLTDAGEEFYRQTRNILSAVENATQTIRQHRERPGGLLRVSVPPLGYGNFREQLVDFAEAYPEVRLDVRSSSLHEDLLAENIDVAWRAGVDIDPGLVARKLFSAELIAVASPSYLAAAGTPASTAELKDHNCILGYHRGEHPATHWPLRQGGKLPVQGNLVCNDISLHLEALRRGLGIAMVPRLFVETALRAKEVVQILPDELGATSQVALVYLDRKLIKPAVRAFVDYIAEATKSPANAP